MAPNRIEDEIPEAWLVRIDAWDEAQAKAQKRQARQSRSGSPGTQRTSLI